MVRRRTKTLVATLAILTLVLSSVFSGAVTAQSSAPAEEDAPRALQQAAFPGDYVCSNFYTLQLRFVFSPSCNPGSEMLIQISASLPFDYCYSLYTGLISDDRFGDVCPGTDKVYVEIDGLSSFFVCLNFYTGQMYHLNSPTANCAGALVGFIDLRGDITKYACTEDNLNLDECDFFPAGGPQNEIRHYGPLVGSPFPPNCEWRWEFDGATSAVQECVPEDITNSAIEAALESLPGINDVIVTGGPVVGTGAAPIRIEFVGLDAATDIVPKISTVPVIGGTVPQDDFTVVDGSPNSPGTSYVMPDGMVQIFQASGATDPNNPATYGPLVTSGATNAAGSFSATNLLEGDYVVCATGTGAISPSCEIVTVFDDAQTIVNNVDLPGTISAEITATGTDEVQSYNDFDTFGYVDGGFYTITFDGATTTVLDWDADASTIETALNALSSIGGVGGSVTVTGDPPGFDSTIPAHGPEVVITFGGNLGSTNVPSITIDSSNLTGSGGCCGGTYFVNWNLDDIDGSGATQTLTADRKVSGGTFTLTFDGDETVPLAWNADAATVAAALNNLPSINTTGSVNVIGQLVPNVPIEELVQHQMDVQFTDVPGSDTIVLIVDNTNLE